MRADLQNRHLAPDQESWLLNCVYNLMLGTQPYVLAVPPSPVSPTVRFYGQLERSITTDVLDRMVMGLHPESESYGIIAVGCYQTPVEKFCRQVISTMTLFEGCKLTAEEETVELKQAMAQALGAQSFGDLEKGLKRGEILQRTQLYLDEMFAWVEEKIADARHELAHYGEGNKNKREGYEADLRVWPRMEDGMHKLESVLKDAIYKGVLDEEAIDHAIIIAKSQLPELQKEINDWWPLATALQIGLVESALEIGLKKDAPVNHRAMDLLLKTAADWHIYLDQSHVEYWPVNTRPVELALRQAPRADSKQDQALLNFARCLHDAAQTYQKAKTFQFPDKDPQLFADFDRAVPFSQKENPSIN